MMIDALVTALHPKIAKGKPPMPPPTALFDVIGGSELLAKLTLLLGLLSRVPNAYEAVVRVQNVYNTVHDHVRGAPCDDMVIHCLDD